MQGQVSSTYVRLLFEFLERRGLDALQILGEPAPVTDGPGGLARFPVARWAALLDRADHALAEPALGLQVGALIAPSHFGLLGYLSLCCSNLAEALQRMREYERLVYDVNASTIHLEPTGVRLEWGDEQGRPGQLVDECAIAALVAYARNLTDLPRAAPLEVRFINPRPRDLAPYEAFFGCAVTFDSATTVVRLPLGFLNQPLRQPDPGLKALLDAQAREHLARLPPRDDFEARLREALVGLLREGTPSLRACAQRLHCSERTLQRRLDRHETGFQQLLDRTRQQLAESYLHDPRLKLAEVAQLLGYADQAAFTRAFARWNGVTPGRWRERAV